jgi:hypothetical protein
MADYTRDTRHVIVLEDPHWKCRPLVRVRRPETNGLDAKDS